tara:strand:- start:1225 stop:1797 length:573 start_codon:yes stop_codon:yes gene_type:complete
MIAGTKSSQQIDKVTFELQGMPKVIQMFKQIEKWKDSKAADAAWVRLWKKTMMPLQDAAKRNAPLLGDSGTESTSSKFQIPYPPNKKLYIKRGTLKNSIEWFRTAASRDYNGGYIGPIVKGKFSKNKGGYYGAWIEYGDQVEHFGKYTSEGKTFMKDAFKAKGSSVIRSIYPLAEKMYKRAARKFAKQNA